MKCLQVKKEDIYVRCTVSNNVVGTLDLSIRQLLHGETFPGVSELFSLMKSSNSMVTICSHIIILFAYVVPTGACEKLYFLY